MDRIKENHELNWKHLISSYRYGNENVFTFGQINQYPTYQNNPEYYENDRNPIISWTYQVVHVEVDGDDDSNFVMEFDNMTDAYKLHKKLYDLASTDEWKAYFKAEHKKRMNEMFDNIEDRNQLRELLSLDGEK